MKVAVIFGGTSSEREVSVLSGLSAAESLGKKYMVKPIHYNGNPGTLLNDLYDIDIVFNALHGGDGENGNIQSFFEIHNISYVGSNSEASKLAMDKDITKSIAHANSIPTPNWISIIADDYNDKSNVLYKSDEKLNFPLVVKPANEGSTVGISKISSEDQLDWSIALAAKYSKKILIEEYVDGRELSVSILGNKALPIVEIITEGNFYDYDAKYNSSSTKYITPASLDYEVEKQISTDAIKLYRLMGCENYARVDYRLDAVCNHKLLEINTLPGLTPTSIFPKSASAAGLEYDELLSTLIELGTYKYANNI